MTAQDLSRVPGRSHYSLRYLRGGRVFSYAHQIDAVLSFEPQSVLEIGVGTGVVAAALRALGIAVTTLDIQADLGPDLEGSVTDVPLSAASVDVALCCQVLEHLPFDQLEPALRELRRVTRSGLVLSLPDASPYYRMVLRLPLLGETAWFGTRSRRLSADVIEQRWKDAGHYWELGYPNVSKQHVLNAAARVGWTVCKTWRVPECPYHHFFKMVHRN